MAGFGGQSGFGFRGAPRAMIAPAPQKQIRSVSFDRLDERWARNYQVSLRRRLARIKSARAVLTPRRALSIRGAMGVTTARFEGLLEDVRAAREALEPLGDMTEADVVTMETAAAADGIGQALGQLGNPVDVYAVIRGCAREQFRRAAAENAEPPILTYAAANIDYLYSQMGEYEGLAANYFGEARLIATRFMGSNAASLVSLGTRLARWWESTSDGTSTSLIRAQAEAAMAGIRGVVDRAVAGSTDWITDDMKRGAGVVLRTIMASASAPNAKALISALGTGITDISSLLGPAAPYVGAAGAVVSAVSVLADLLASIFSEPPPARKALTPYAEHWAVLKLYLSAMNSAYDGVPVGDLKTQGWDVRCDPVTGETCVKPPSGSDGGFTSPIPGWTRTWNSYVRVIDIFDRRTLVNDHMMTWMRGGAEIQFYSSEEGEGEHSYAGKSPCRLYDFVPVTEDFVRYAGSETFSPAVRDAGSPSVVGPRIDWDGFYWMSQEYKAAVLGAALVGGCPPYANYGEHLGEWYARAGEGGTGEGRWWAATNQFDRYPHCLGIGGNRLHDGPDDPVGHLWIPWAAVTLGVHRPSGTCPPGYGYRPVGCSNGEPVLIAPRMAPFRIQDYGNTNGEKRNWLIGDSVPGDTDLSPMVPRTRLRIGDTIYDGMYIPTQIDRGHSDVRSAYQRNWVGLRQFVEEHLSRPYDQADPRTWFPRETRRSGAFAGSSISSRFSLRPFTPMSVAQAKPSSVGTIAVVGGLSAAALAAWLLLK